MLPLRPHDLRLPGWTNTNVLHLNAEEVVNVLDVLLGVLWQLLPRLHAGGVAVPAWQSLVVDLDLVEHIEIGWEGRQLLASLRVSVSSRHLELFEVIQNLLELALVIMKQKGCLLFLHRVS